MMGENAVHLGDAPYLAGLLAEGVHLELTRTSDSCNPLKP